MEIPAHEPTMPTADPEPTELLPLSEAVFHILLALGGPPLHGYGIMREVEDRTGGRVTLGPGTLYGAIRRLREQGLLEEVAEAPEGEDPRRRCYRLTSLGRRVAVLEAERLERLVSAARRKGLAPGSERA